MTTLIDGEELQARLSRELVETAEIVPQHHLSDVLKTILLMRQQTRSMLVNRNMPISERDSLLAMLEGMSEKYFLAVATIEKQNLPPELAEILNIQQMVDEMVDITESGKRLEAALRPAPAKPLKKGRKRKIVKEEELSSIDLLFRTVIHHLSGILGEMRSLALDVELREGAGTMLKDEKHKAWLKFHPFIELAKRTEMDPKDWMDCDSARKYCAEWLSSQFGITTMQSTAFYAHVTAKFRNKPNSMWQVYKAELEQKAAQQEEEGQKEATSEQSADPDA